MEKRFSAKWIESSQRRKQRKYRYNAPLHLKRKFMAAHLSKELRKKYSKRSAVVRKGDRVKVERGSFKDKTAKVSRVDVRRELVYLEGIDRIKKDGSKSPVGLHPSNITILDIVTDDKERVASLARKQ
ncbi:50S ribosomal protein L24 [Candidatus Woesearchaeota archaeon]|nr:50S ribosomal protein L24 [Candidatus Woesearchaeota archaeon]